MYNNIVFSAHNVSEIQSRESTYDTFGVLALKVICEDGSEITIDLFHGKDGIKFAHLEEKDFRKRSKEYDQ